jgi:diguanylate cyclase (GGDEF)-like protein
VQEICPIAPSRTRTGIRRLRLVLPKGRLLPDSEWRRRHRALVWILSLHLPALLAFGLLRGYPLWHVSIDLAPIALLTAVALHKRAGRRIRSSAAAVGLVTCSAILVHLWGGQTEGHFHFFVVVGLLALYQDWTPFLLALVYVVVHHGVMGAIDARSVYDHPSAIAHPWQWAGIHAAFVVAASAASLVSWRVNEQLVREPLTGLPGRLIFLDRVSQAIARLERRPATIAVMFIDLDRFKLINDSLGHAIGDRLLIATARRLEGAMRRHDTVARLGGDEFAILTQDVDGERGLVALAQRLDEVISQPLEIDGHQIQTAASLGIAITTDPAAAVTDMMRDADVAMYRAKERGGGHEVFDPSMHERVMRRMEVETALRQALDRGELQLAYQPELCLRTGAVVAVEALLRWRHPERGSIPPVEFIPIAEETGLILPIGQWVLEEACRQARAWRDEVPGAAPLRMRVNLSPRQLSHPQLGDDVERTLARHRLDPRSLDLELTESALMDEGDGAAAALCALKRRGVRISIDDFGTGHSSLAHLKDFPVDTLKVDRSFIAALGHDARDEALLRSIVDLAHALGLSVTAEGIETQEQLDTVTALGCDHAQGFRLGVPGAPEAIAGLLRGAVASAA